jgi:hypothetical protein
LKDVYFVFFAPAVFDLTPAPPPFSSMNSEPALSTFASRSLHYHRFCFVGFRSRTPGPATFAILDGYIIEVGQNKPDHTYGKQHDTIAVWEGAPADLTNRGEVVLDPFLGTGATLIAADNAGRVCRGVECDPRDVDLIIRRYEVLTRKAAVLTEIGETFAALAARRSEGLLVMTADGGLV